MKKTAVFKLALLAGMVWPLVAEAQDQAPANDEDAIIVTARRTSENLQEVPVAVTALSGEALQARGVDTLDQVARYTPNIRFDGAAQLSGGNYNATVFIRGVGQNDFAIFSDPGVGFYVDDVYYARSIGGILDAIDIDSVQVLRGPQGTLFGKNTIGGAVLINTAKPDVDDFSGKVEATTGSYNRIDVKGVINIPLVPGSLGLRVSGGTLNRDGYVKSLYSGQDYGNRNADMIRGKLRYEGGPLTIDLAADYTRAREHSAPSDLLAVGNVPGISGVPFLSNYNRDVAPTRGIIAPNGQPTLNPSFITDSPFRTWANGPNINNLDLWGVQGIVGYDFGDVTLKSITAYRHMKAEFARDGDNTPFTFRETRNDDKQWQFSQELQLSGEAIDGRMKFVLGGFYFKEKASDIAAADLAVGLWPPLATTAPFSPAVFIENYTNNKSYAGYGQIDFEIVDRLTLTLGGRYGKDEKTFRSVNTRQRDNVTFIDTTVNGSFSKFTPYAGVKYQATEDVMLYASYSRGYKQGGFNGRPLASAAEVTQYRPEVLDTFEAGIKAELIDRTLTANLAAFHSIYKDIQLTVNQTPQNFVANAAKGKIDGFEAELVMRPARWFSSNLSVGYLDARYTEIGQGLGPTQILPITLDSHFVKAPKWTVSAGSEISHEFDNGGKIALRGDVSVYSKIYQDVANTPIVTEHGYVLANARLTWSLPGDRLRLSVFGTNLTDSLYIVSGNASGAFGLAEASYGRPREWGASASFSF